MRRNEGTWGANRAEGQLTGLYSASQPSLLFDVSDLFAFVHYHASMVTWHYVNTRLVIKLVGKSSLLSWNSLTYAKVLNE